MVDVRAAQLSLSSISLLGVGAMLGALLMQEKIWRVKLLLCGASVIFASALVILSALQWSSPGGLVSVKALQMVVCLSLIPLPFYEVNDLREVSRPMLPIFRRVSLGLMCLSTCLKLSLGLSLGHVHQSIVSLVLLLACLADYLLCVTGYYLILRGCEARTRQDLKWSVGGCVLPPICILLIAVLDRLHLLGEGLTVSLLEQMCFVCMSTFGARFAVLRICRARKKSNDELSQNHSEDERLWPPHSTNEETALAALRGKAIHTSKMNQVLSSYADVMVSTGRISMRTWDKLAGELATTG
ncbi:MAG: hypothetical protein M4579_005229 [Chaenotheca gracillima]|nr:MAG: hypothetical protein M4579_005229 [Chaenotheca gracillima]